MHHSAVQQSAQRVQRFSAVLVSMVELLTRKAMSEDGRLPSQIVCLAHVGDVPSLVRLTFVLGSAQIKCEWHVGNLRVTPQPRP